MRIVFLGKGLQMRSICRNFGAAVWTWWMVATVFYPSAKFGGGLTANEKFAVTVAFSATVAAIP